MMSWSISLGAWYVNLGLGLAGSALFGRGDRFRTLAPLNWGAVVSPFLVGLMARTIRQSTVLAALNGSAVFSSGLLKPKSVRPDVSGSC